MRRLLVTTKERSSTGILSRCKITDNSIMVSRLPIKVVRIQIKLKWLTEQADTQERAMWVAEDIQEYQEECLINLRAA